MFDINVLHTKICPRNASKCPSLIFPEKISFYRNFRADSLFIRFARVRIDTNQLLNGLIAGQPHFFLYAEHSIDQRSTRCSRYPDLDTEHVFQSTLTLTVTICRRDTSLVPACSSNRFVSRTCPLYAPQSESRIASESLTSYILRFIVRVVSRDSSARHFVDLTYTYLTGSR